MITAILAAASAPPTGQQLTAALPAIIALAALEQPAKPQPPQLAPGRQSMISGKRGSVLTSKILEATARIRPKARPMMPSTRTAETTFITSNSILLAPPYHTFRPEKPMKARAIRPAVTSARGKPSKHLGESANSSRSRMDANSTIASRKPRPPVIP